ncbi:MAG: AraC family transcriptional regulator, partial [Candidatus Competibacteraceae bacterium]|nr:AraC family transcriptional regulator [Candidatus Competibacteraceae bacterium]
MAEGFEGGPIKRIGFLLVPDFSMLPFSAAVEPLRVANRLTRCPLYEWQLYSVDGQPVTASNTIPVAVDQGLDPFPRPELALVCAGLGCQRFEAPLALKWLRTLAREGLGVGGISSGSHILGRAGLLAGYRCTIHWEDRVSFRETFPGMLDTDGVFEIDRNRYTCSGGTA